MKGSWGSLTRWPRLKIKRGKRTHAQICGLVPGDWHPWLSPVENIMAVGAPLVAQTVKNLPARWETQVWSLGQEDALEKGLATHSGILAWRIPWTEEPGGLCSMSCWTEEPGGPRVRRNWATNITLCDRIWCVFWNLYQASHLTLWCSSASLERFILFTPWPWVEKLWPPSSSSDNILVAASILS